MTEIKHQKSEVNQNRENARMANGGWRIVKPTSDLRVLISGLCAFLALSFSPPTAFALGPWKAQVIDAETKQPLQGVVVVALWKKYVPTPGTLGIFTYVDSVEAATGGDGWFVVAARKASRAASHTLDEPDFCLFKPGYGEWRFQGEEGWSKLDPAEKKERYVEAGRRFESKGVIIEMPPLKTREERAQFFQSPSRRQPHIAPPDKIKRWTDAQQAERQYLGL